MKPLWKAAPSVFEAGLNRYEAALPQKPNIKPLETFLTTLRKEVETRLPQHITSEEYSKLIKWKLTRGKWRPRLQKFADAVSDDVMVPASERAFRLYREGDKRGALRVLTEIKGCGPASGSLVLALVGACFMGDEVLDAAFGERVYSVKTFLGLQDAVDDLCRRLGEWSAWDVERAVFAIVKLGLLERKRERDFDVENVVRRASGGVKGSVKGGNGDSAEKEDPGEKKDAGEREVAGLRRSKRIRKIRGG